MRLLVTLPAARRAALRAARGTLAAGGRALTGGRALLAGLARLPRLTLEALRALALLTLLLGLLTLLALLRLAHLLHQAALLEPRLELAVGLLLLLAKRLGELAELAHVLVVGRLLDQIRLHEH